MEILLFILQMLNIAPTQRNIVNNEERIMNYYNSNDENLAARFGDDSVADFQEALDLYFDNGTGN
jgi:hypothetical protein